MSVSPAAGRRGRAGIAAAARLRPRPQVVVVLTDGYTPWPRSAPEGISVVVGATGWTAAEILTLSERAQAAHVGAMLVPNFSLGANLMMRFAEQAALVFGRGEIIELHHDRKRDAPSGTAKLTARRIAATGAPEPPIHSVRLPGFVAHQEVIFGGTGETLTIRHDSLAHTSFAAGIVAAVRDVRSFSSLVVGFDALLDRMLAT